MVLVFAFGFSACSTDNRFLPALKADPMASYEAEGIVLEGMTTQGRGKSFVTGKPVYAELTRLYVLTDPETTDDVMADAFEAAVAAGWVFDHEPSENVFGNYSTLGHKDFDWGPASISIAVGQLGGDSDSPVRLIVDIEE
jgi:hypothetical protein